MQTVRKITLMGSIRPVIKMTGKNILNLKQPIYTEETQTDPTLIHMSIRRIKRSYIIRLETFYY